jgi:anti-sigma regulatory factor (Ser/Thr protein kinase)
MVENCGIYREWILENRFGAEKLVMEEIARTVYTLERFSKRVEDMMTVISEACLNAFEHGNRLNPDAKVRILMSIGDDVFQFRIYDEGEGFHYNPARHKSKPNIADGQCRGWGLLLISSLADQVDTGFENGRFYIEVYFKRMGGKQSARE